MKDPKKVKIGWITFKIIWYDDKAQYNQDCEDAGDKAGDNEGGCTWENAQQIWILNNPHSTRAYIRETLLHEILHACADVTGLGNTLVQGVKKGGVEEAVVGSLSPALLAVLRDNPKVLAYLLGD